MVKQNMKHFNRLFVVLDVMLLCIALFLSWAIRFKSGWVSVGEVYLPFEDYMRPLVVLIPVYTLTYNFFDLYRPHRTKSLVDEFGNILKANLVGIAIFFIYLYVTKNIHYSRVLLVMFLGVNTGLSLYERLVLRAILRRIRKSQRNMRHIIFVGVSDIALDYSKRIFMNPHWGYTIEGVFDNHINRKYINFHKQAIKMLGSIDDLEDYLKETSVDEVVITLSLKDYDFLEQAVSICEKYGAQTKIIPAYNKVIPAKPYIEDVDGVPVISIRNVPLNDVVNRFVKRTIDIGASLFGIIVLLPFFAVVAVLIKISSRGPIIFKQARVGINRNDFNMFKFRSMVMQTEEQEKAKWTVKDDPRVTKIGGFMRRTSIDELPQLFNVLKGDMSLVGPRPERPQFVDKFKEEIPKYNVKHQVRPGITGWAQVHGLRGDTSIKKRIEYDLYYIENWTFKMDIKILLMTVFGRKTKENAY